MKGDFPNKIYSEKMSILITITELALEIVVRAIRHEKDQGGRTKTLQLFCAHNMVYLEKS
jgi:hypothetical protein